CRQKRSAKSFRNSDLYQMRICLFALQFVLSHPGAWISRVNRVMCKRACIAHTKCQGRESRGYRGLRRWDEVVSCGFSALPSVSPASRAELQDQARLTGLFGPRSSLMHRAANVIFLRKRDDEYAWLKVPPAFARRDRSQRRARVIPTVQ